MEYTLYICTLNIHVFIQKVREHRGSVVECLTRDRGAAGVSLIGITVMYP